MLNTVAERGNTFVFGASPELKLLTGSYLVLFVWVLANVRHVAAAYVVTAAFAVLPLFVWPAAITLNDSGISSRTIWGQRTFIPWFELRHVVVAQKEILMVANNGQTIRHTQLHGRRGLLRDELSRRVPEKVVFKA